MRLSLLRALAPIFPATSNYSRLLRVSWLAAALLSIAACLAVWDWHLSVGLAVMAALCCVCAITSARSAVCPGCGGPSRAIGRHRRVVLCSSCVESSRSCHAPSESLPASYVHPSPVFTAKLRAETKWAGCVACRALATRTLTCRISERRHGKGSAFSRATVALLDTIGIAFIQHGAGKAWRVRMPFCDAHHHGAIVDIEGGEVVIRFRAYAAWRAFVRANAG